MGGRIHLKWLRKPTNRCWYPYIFKTAIFLFASGAGMLIDLSDRNNLGGGGAGGGGGGYPAPQPAGFIGYPQAPQLPPMPMVPSHVPFSYPAPGSASAQPSAPPPFNYNIPPNMPGSNSCPPGTNMEKKDLNINSQFLRVNITYKSFEQNTLVNAF